MPSITYTPRLLEYMQKKGRPHVVVDTCSAKTCGGALAELSIYLADDVQAEGLRAKAHATYKSDVGSVLVMPRGLEVADSVTFGLRSFLGAKDVTVQGIRPYRF